MRKYVYSTEACCIYNFKSGNREWNGTELRLNWETTQKKTAHTQTHTRIFQKCWQKHWNEREWRLKSTCAGHDVEHTHFSAIKMVSVCHIQAVNKRKMIIVTMNEVRRGRMRYRMARKYSVTHVYNTPIIRMVSAPDFNWPVGNRSETFIHWAKRPERK